MLLSLFGSAQARVAAVCSETERNNHPALCHMLQWAEDDLDAFVRDAQVHAAEHGLLVGQDWVLDGMELPAAGNTETIQRSLRGLHEQSSSFSSPQLPVVFAHGMGDSCFNSGMQHITAHASTLLGGVYSTCIGTGKDQAEDTKNGYFLNMDASVDVFAAAVAADPNLQNGFHAIGFSQGNNVIRGYITRYNTPAVHTFISINGVNAGTGAVPNCFPTTSSSTTASDNKDGNSRLFGWCDYLNEQASRRAYTEFAQQHSFQANYWRDPRPSAYKKYQEYCQLAKVRSSS